MSLAASAVRVAVRIRGTSPLIVHRFTDAAAMAATEGTRSSMIGGQLSAREQAEQSLYMHDGVPVIPQPNLFRSLIDAGSFIKSGKSKMSTQRTSLVPACLSIEEVASPIISDSDWSVDTRPVRIPSTGGRVLRHRPIFERWSLEFHLLIDTEILAEKVARQLVDIAGSRIGLGDFRPACKGPYGRFVVDRWDQD
jgi:hypothetical protein